MVSLLVAECVVNITQTLGWYLVEVIVTCRAAGNSLDNLDVLGLARQAQPTTDSGDGTLAEGVNFRSSFFEAEFERVAQIHQIVVVNVLAALHSVTLDEGTLLILRHTEAAAQCVKLSE